MIKILQLTKFKTMLVLVSVLFYSDVVFAFPAGNYTINPAAAATANNYLSFTAFANDLRNTTRGDAGPAQYAVGGAGLQGHVVVNVTPGTYTGQILLTAIVGSSATRTVTINGNGAIVEFTPSVTSDAGVINLNGTDFFIFNDLEVRMNQTLYGYCYRIYNGADNNIIKRNKLRCNNITATPNTGSAYIWINNGTTSNTSGNSGNNNLIDSNDMRSGPGTNHGPFYGVNVYGITTPAASNAGNNNIISNNLIRDFHNTGINHSFSYATIIRNNTITNQGRTTVFGTKNGTNASTATFRIENNRIFNLNGNTPQTSTIYPIFISMSSTAVPVYESKITNNWIYDFGTSMLQCYLYWYSAYTDPNISLDVEYNTIAFDYPTLVNNTNTGVRNVQGGWFRSFTNNILYNNMGGTGSKWLIYDQATTTTTVYRWTTYRNNCLFFGPNAAGNLQYGYGVQNAGGTAVGDLSTIQDMYTASFPNNNIAADPSFLSINPASIDLTPRSIPMSSKGRPIVGITRDINGVTRNATRPDIGAIEYDVNVEMTAINVNFPTPACSGMRLPIGGTLKNNSIFVIDNPVVAYSVNNGPKVQYAIPGSINPGSSTNFTFPNQQQFSVSGLTTVRLFVDSPDDSPSNDTLSTSTTVSPAPSGSSISLNTTQSSVFAQFSSNINPDLTFRDESIVYDLGEPTTLGYTNADYGVKWTAFVTAKTINGANANAIVSSNNAAPFIATLNPTAMWEDSTIEVSIRVQSLESFCDTIYTRRVFIAPKANIDLLLPKVLCERTEIYFENLTTVKSGSLEYEWDFGDGSPTTDELSPIKSYDNFGSYTVSLKVTTKPYNFVSQKTFNIDITEMPVAKISNVNNCEGQNIILNNGTSYAGGGTTVYDWAFSDNSPNIITTSRTAVNKMFSTAGAYNVTLTATADGCSDVISKTVYQYAKPIAAFSKANGDCLNDAYLFNNQTTISEGLFGNAWFWDDNSNIATDMNPTYTFTSAGLKNVKLRVNSEFGCKDSAFLQVNVKQIPTTDFIVPFACDRTPTPFTNLTNLNGETLNKYTWDLGQGSPSNATAPIVSWSNLGPRTIKLTTLLANGCSTSASKDINIGVQPTVSFDVENQCAGSVMAFANLTTYPSGQISYKWNFGDGNTTATATPTHTYTNGQTYSVKLIGTILNGCADSMTKNVNVGKLPSTCDFDITRDWVVNSKNFKFTPTGGALTGTQYTWVTGDGNKLNSTATGANYTYNANLQYCVTMVASSTDGCECTKTKCIDVSTDINNINALNFSIYPNPSNGVFNVKSTSTSNQMTVLVYNVIGEIVKTFDFQNNEGIMNLSHLNNGVYIVKVITDNQSSTQKINIIK